MDALCGVYAVFHGDPSSVAVCRVTVLLFLFSSVMFYSVSLLFVIFLFPFVVYVTLTLSLVTLWCSYYCC
jgi:hypothetical protein